MKIYKLKNHQKGVTIIELLVYVGLLSMFMIVLLDVFTSILGAKVESQSTSGVSQDTRYILSKLTYEINNADSISAPANFGVTANSLTLVDGANSYTYSLDGAGNLNIISAAGTQRLNGADTKITDISFTKLGNAGVIDNKPTIRVSFTVESLIEEPSGQQEQTINTTVGLR